MSALLTAPYETKRIIDKYGIHAKKKYGQNFLIDAGVVEGIVEAAGVTREDTVLEIGPGIGTMTQELSLAAGHVVAVEIDTSLAPILEETLDACENVSIIFQDVLKTDLRALCDEYNGAQPMKCVANLPYYITTPILLQLLKEKRCFQSITVMVQQEVADRILASEQDKEYGALSLAVQFYSHPEQVLRVPPHSFIPRPAVDSAVLRLEVYEEPPVEANEDLMFALIRAAFNQRRKTLANALTHGLSYPGLQLSRDDVTAALAQMDLTPDIRGEKLSLAQFGRLSRILQP